MGEIMEEKSFCSFCGEKIDYNARFCRNCSHEIKHEMSQLENVNDNHVKIRPINNNSATRKDTNKQTVQKCLSCGYAIKKDFLFCPECGNPIASDIPFTNATFSEKNVQFKDCQRCGAKMPVDSIYCLACGKKFKNIFYPVDDFETVSKIVKESMNQRQGVWKNKWVSLLLCIFLGWIGAHKFYEGKIGMGILYICTFGLLGFGWIIDIFRIAIKTNPYRVK